MSNYFHDLKSKMDEETQESHSKPQTDPEVALKKCISILKSAKSDNERFAGLMLVTQLVKSESLDGKQRRELFNAVGFKFINRLLNTTAVPEECPEGVFKSLAIAMLACFCTDQELLFHLQMTEKIPLLNHVISNTSEGEAVVSDAYQIIAAFASSAKGSECLIDQGTVNTLCQVSQKSTVHGSKAFNILLSLLHFHSSKIWECHSKDMLELLCYLAEKLNTLQDLTKFDVCKSLVSFLSGTDKSLFSLAMETSGLEEHWKQNLNKGIKDILKSKVKPEHRDSALVLLSIIINLAGGLDAKSLGNQLTGDFLVFIATLVSIEIRLGTDGTSDHILSRSDILIACYCILEHLISELITLPDQKSKGELGNTAMSSKVYSQITEAMLSVLKFLQQEAIHGEIQDVNKGFVFASARVLFCWLAEESVALHEDVLKVLPFLMKLVWESVKLDVKDAPMELESRKKVSFEDDKTNNSPSPSLDIFCFMLPSLCHLSADDQARKILIDNSLPDLLSKYFSILWARWCDSQGTDFQCKTSLVTLTGVLLNFAVTEPVFVKSSKVFQDLATHIREVTPGLVSSSNLADLVSNFIVLGLMLTKEQVPKQGNEELVSFYEAVIAFFRESSICAVKGSPKIRKWSKACHKEWDTISELWFLGIQVLAASIRPMPLVREVIIRSGWVTELSQIVSQPIIGGDKQQGNAKEMLQYLLNAVNDSRCK